MITIEINPEAAVLELARVRGLLRRPRPWMAPLGRYGANRLRSHFQEKDKVPNKLGGRREHFWLKVKQATNNPHLNTPGNVATIGINHPAFAQKVHGGRIRAKRGRLLTIPVDSEAYGRYVATFEKETGLKLIFIRQRDKALLATRAANSKFLQVRYILTPYVDQDPDPTALPPWPAFAVELRDRAFVIIKRLLSTPPNTPNPNP